MSDFNRKIAVNDAFLTVVRQLGKGKGGYSYLVTDGTAFFVVKQIHHEPCDYYTFGDKLQSELDDYKRLREVGIPVPRLLDSDVATERILKEYIDGDVISDIIARGLPCDKFVAQIRAMCEKLYAAGLNIDYYPTNFVVSDGTVYYIDYECNEYSDEWNFENWGEKFYRR